MWWMGVAGSFGCSVRAAIGSPRGARVVVFLAAVILAFSVTLVASGFVVSPPLNARTEARSYPFDASG